MIARFQPTSNPAHLRTRESFDHSPMLCFYEVTRACDLVCQHCRACAQERRDPGELTTRQSQRLIDQLTEFPQPPMLILTGGDPLKRADLFALIRYATESGLQVSITPSPTPLVTRDAIARLRDAGISRMGISIDGADAATHDGNRGVPGSFRHSMDMLAAAADLGLSTQINTTLTPANVHQIEVMADNFAKVRTDMWSVFFLIPVGRAVESERLSGEQCEAAFQRLYTQSLKQPYRIKTTEAMHYRRFMIQQQTKERRDASITSDHPRPSGASHRPFMPAGINDGKGVMFVSHTGLIHPTGFLPVTCGVFPRQSVVDVYQNSPVFRKLRDPRFLKGKCGRCEFNKICGGSRARAYGATGDLLAEEPDCIYIPKVDRRAARSS